MRVTIRMEYVVPDAISEVIINDDWNQPPYWKVIYYTMSVRIISCLVHPTLQASFLIPLGVFCVIQIRPT